MHDLHDLRSARALWDHLPLGVFVADDSGIVRLVNARALAMTGWERADQVVGRSALDFVVHDDLAFVAEGLARSDDFPDVVLGPFRVRYIARDGGTHWSECWAYHTPDGLGFDGHIVTIAAESVAERLATALRGIATGAEIGTSLENVAAALGAFPVAATASVLTVDRGQAASSSGPFPFGLLAGGAEADAPWGRCAGGGPDDDRTADQLPSPWRDAALRAGVGAIWTRGIDVDGQRRGVLVMARGMRVDPTPNQLRHIRDALDVAALAFSQHDHRSRLARAADTDHLTGVGNRARFDQAIAAGVQPSGVLYVDLDGFKSVNDRFGHRVGDVVLRDVADRLVRTTGSGDRIYRIGGDEFVVLCGVAPDPVEPSVVASVAARVVDAIGRPFHVDDESIEISATVGVAYRRPGVGVHDLLELADRALLGAKRAGKRRWSDGVTSVDARPHRRPALVGPDAGRRPGLTGPVRSP